jgi:hypothetical protein
LSIVAYRLVKENPVEYEYVAIGMAQVDKIGVYNFDNSEVSGVSFFNEYCDYEKSSEVSLSGSLEVTKLDLQNGIVSGKFSFTLAKSGCETIHVTDGRFDGRL